ncbi:fermentation-respiration switch protein FrsA (DUF1100 family) [Rhodoblastus acidophilus]|uniref:alpha/beta hydrolase n=1 Tax=Rhodoblastus acidophilus TaxID=1074 RepID=UPI0022249E18|nr:alpha/beta hydrolase [Rhodoblastus acidophilus]MCW2285190.1 fermentation-respiration switch protein FrsA (DUF1100 family) [Rhodoblastus acidophilus]MCW2334146.1 fermentation-respiration switch protein FrsA (DUF1100 family) [Rhodoblastus acidophilus]
MAEKYTRDDITFTVNGVTLAGWLYKPSLSAAEPKRSPAIVMTHGFSCVKDLYIDRFAERFAQAGFAVLLYDHRNFGHSGGDIRGEIDPLQQVADMREAVTWLRMQPEINSEGIGLWGTSYSGGHVILLGGQDRRVKCVVAQVPTISGLQTFLRRVPPGAVASVRADFARDRAARLAGEKPEMRHVIPTEAAPGIYNGPDAVSFWTSAAVVAPTWRNAVTVRSLELASEYEPGMVIDRIGPTPLLMIVADKDDVTPTDLALAAYNRATEPKRLRMISGGHFAPYVDQFEAASSEALAWFTAHLCPAR